MMDGRVILLNSGKTDAYLHLAKFVPATGIDVITERKYTALYPSNTNLHYVNDIADATEVLNVARKLDSSDSIAAVVSPSERSLPVGGYLRTYFNLPGTGFDVAWGFANKSVMKSKLRSAGVEVARSLTISNIEQLVDGGDEIGWPVVVKPVIGSGSMNTYKINDREEAASFLERPQADWFRKSRYQIIVEEYIKMKGEYHCDAIIQNGQVVFFVLQRYFSPLLECTGAWGGSIMIGKGDERYGKISAIYPKVVKALGLKDGVTHMEVFWTGTKFIVGEISCRPAGGGIPKSILLKYGIDLWDAFTAASLNLEYNHKASELIPGIMANIDLPVQTGRLVDICTIDELSSIDGFVSADLSPVGTLFSEPLNSSSATGIVYIQLQSDTELVGTLQQLKERYHSAYES
ncbi:ATP-grasp domain-containing protein [Bifidobacterium longum]|jgi:hypothetical protein|nr:ATP-grasp domain-containing protein [Bifidobacterium longum]MDW3109493.1 ATP-grasp domain-containing protein [Bifidobacterium longum]